MNVTHREIVEYWAARESDAGLGVNWSEAETRCWRCGYEGRLERCHIVPSALGGADEPHNLVLLCKRCHREAPNVADPRYMWIWLRKTCVPFYDTFWTWRALKEYEQMFGGPPLSRFDESAFSANREGLIRKRFEELLRQMLTQAIIHYGEGRLNPSTLACVVHMAEEQLAKEFADTIHQRGRQA